LTSNYNKLKVLYIYIYLFGKINYQINPVDRYLYKYMEAIISKIMLQNFPSTSSYTNLISNIFISTEFMKDTSRTSLQNYSYANLTLIHINYTWCLFSWATCKKSKSRRKSLHYKVEYWLFKLNRKNKYEVKLESNFMFKLD
jgi:hypothetical protein